MLIYSPIQTLMINMQWKLKLLYYSHPRFQLSVENANGVDRRKKKKEARAKIQGVGIYSIIMNR